MNENETRETLIERLKNRKDQNSWDEFYKWYERYIKAIIAKAGVAEDCIADLHQDIMLRLWKGLETFDYVPEKCRFRTWLGKVCRNCIYSHFEKENKKKSVDIDKLPIISKPEIDSIIETEWKLYISQMAYERIEGRFQQNILTAYRLFQEGEKPSDIAAKLAVAENTIYVYNKRVKGAMTREIILLINDLG